MHTLDNSRDVSPVTFMLIVFLCRRELYYAGVTFHTIQPGAFKTSIVDPEVMKSTLQKAFDAADSEVQAFYGQKWLQESE